MSRRISMSWIGFASLSSSLSVSLESSDLSSLSASTSVEAAANGKRKIRETLLRLLCHKNTKTPKKITKYLLLVSRNFMRSLFSITASHTFGSDAMEATTDCKMGNNQTLKNFCVRHKLNNICERLAPMKLRKGRGNGLYLRGGVFTEKSKSLKGNLWNS